jgi:Lipid A 3-O-deacylase (PagL)
MPLADRRACSPQSLKNSAAREFILPLALLFASLAILAPRAGAQQTGNGPANFSFHPIFGGETFAKSIANQNPEPPATTGNSSADFAADQPLNKKAKRAKRPDFNREIFYRNKLEVSLDAGWLPINIPIPVNFLFGDPYTTYPLKYTLVPIFASLRWQAENIGGPWIWRGNVDFEVGGAVTVIPRGPETRYFAFMLGMRRNFVPRNSRIVPYFDVRVGAGNIDAKGPYGVPYAQGQDFTFTANMGSGIRYDFNPRYAITAGLNYMHVSNAGLSEPKVTNFGINVYGPMFGIIVQIHRPKQHAKQ